MQNGFRMLLAGGSAVAFSTLDEAVSFAAFREEEAARFYAAAAAAARTESHRILLRDLESDELRHKALLEKLRTERPASLPVAASPVPDLGLTDDLVEEPIGPDSDAQDILIFAARKEARAADLYRRLSSAASVPEEKKLFEYLVRQELGHKLRLESEYEARILSED